MWCRLCATQRTPPRYAGSMPQPAHTPGLAPFALTWPAEAVNRWPTRYRRKIRHPADGLETSLRRMSTQRQGGRRGLAVYGGCLKSEVRGPMTANWGDSQLGAAVKTRRRALRKAALKATVRATWRTTVGAASRAMVTAPQPATVRGTGTATDRTPGRATQAIAC